MRMSAATLADAPHGKPWTTTSASADGVPEQSREEQLSQAPLIHVLLSVKMAR